ncbi:integrase catalytic domain-containing protein [Trichonephila clavipes]|nr:integrase catalytic domain-containing protein [Trichonephila clavipes]
MTVTLELWIFCKKISVLKRTMIRNTTPASCMKTKFITYKIKVKNILARKAQGGGVLRLTDRGTKFKLPNIELPTFDGNPRDWLNLWTQFEKIHDDVNIDDRDKFQYLIQNTAPRSSPK